MKKAKKSYFGTTVILDLDVLDTSGDGCDVCNDLQEGHCESCQAWVDRVSNEIEQRVFKRFPECSVIWLHECDMGSHAAANPFSISCPDNIYEAVLGN